MLACAQWVRGGQENDAKQGVRKVVGMGEAHQKQVYSECTVPDHVGGQRGPFTVASKNGVGMLVVVVVVVGGRVCRSKDNWSGARRGLFVWG